jgi:hypothetical protein
LGQFQDIDEPRQTNFFQEGAHRRQDAKTNVLIPGSRQDICGPRCGQGATAHKAEVSPACIRNCGRRSHTIEQSQHLQRIAWRIGHRPSELVQGSQRLLRWKYGTVPNLSQVSDCATGRLEEHFSFNFRRQIVSMIAVLSLSPRHYISFFPNPHPSERSVWFENRPAMPASHA